MNSRRFRSSLACASLGLAALLGGCGSTNPNSSSASSSALPAGVSYGAVESIQPAQASGPSGVGAVAGGLLGGVLGNQVGGGVGNTAATVAGAAGGAYAGHQVEKRRGANAGYQLGIRLDNGSYASVVQDSVGDLAVGNRVRIENGRVSRY